MHASLGASHLPESSESTCTSKGTLDVRNVLASRVRHSFREDLPQSTSTLGTQKAPLCMEGGFLIERATGFEPVTFSLARRRSTTEPSPRASAAAQTRTGDSLIFSQVLYQLSYRGAMPVGHIVHENRRLVKCVFNISLFRVQVFAPADPRPRRSARRRRAGAPVPRRRAARAPVESRGHRPDRLL
jgi:hypothetical protein